MQTYGLGGGFKYFLFSSLPGGMIQFDEHIFQMGWFNHQPVVVLRDFPYISALFGLVSYYNDPC